MTHPAHMMHRGWRIDADYGCPSVLHTWTALHPDFDGAPDGCTISAHAATFEELLEEIDGLIEEETPMTFDETLLALCAKHDLTSISVGVITLDGGRAFSRANAHWGRAGDSQCTQAICDTAAEAVAKAITEANELRAVAVEAIDLPSLEIVA